MGFETNRHVDRLNQYIPFDPSHAQIYEESTDPAEAPELPTRALGFVFDALHRAETRLVVLTGDAGHGKTHLCRLVLEKTGIEPAEALRLMKEHPKGDRDFAGNGISIRIVKDLSELDDASAIAVLREASEAAAGGAVKTLVCANEGRLRDVVSRAEGKLDAIRAALDGGLQQGVTTRNHAIHVVNLNYQSTTSTLGGPSLFQELLAQWVLDGRKWRACDRCDARARCPIATNRADLAGVDKNDAHAQRRRSGLHTLLQIVEESGQVVTIRELLILTAYLVTGGLSCDRVAERVGSSRHDDWQWEFAYHEMLFEPRLSKDQRRSLPVLQQFRKLDPGSQSIRRVDEPLSTGAVERTEKFRPPEDTSPDRAVRTRKQAKEEGEKLHDVMTFLRRRDYFDLTTDENIDSLASRAERLGLRFYDDFEALRGGQYDARRFVACRDKLLSGLHAVQGIHSVRGDVHFYVLDPAFGRVQSVACVVARRLPSRNVRIESESAWWHRTGSTTDDIALPKALNWLDRRVVISFGDESAFIDLDLLQFEYVMRASEGLACRNFFRADIRRLMSRIAQLVQQSVVEEESISVLVRGKRRNVTIDRGGLIRSGEG